MKFFKQCGQTIFGICLAFLIMEGVVRIATETTESSTTNDPQTGLLIYTPDSKFTALSRCYKNEIQINHQGFYAPAQPTSKEKNTFRIIVMGNSFVEAIQVGLEQNFTHLLEQKLNNQTTNKLKYEVVPIAFSGNGEYLDLLYYKKYAEQLQPDLVINLATDFLLAKNSTNTTYPPRFDNTGKLILDLPKNVRNEKVIALKNNLRHSKLAMNLYLRALMMKNNLEKSANTLASSSPALIPKTDTFSPDLLETEEKILNTFNQEVKSKNIPFVLVSWVGDIKDMSGHKDFSQGLQTIATKHQIPYLDLQPIILDRTAQEKIQPYWACDGHWNTTGHIWTADAIFEFLRSKPELIETKAKTGNH